MKKHRKCDTTKYRRQQKKHVQEKRRRSAERKEAIRVAQITAEDRKLLEKLLGGSFGGV